jgi:nucleoside phosphorylase
MAERRLKLEDYTVGWISALPIELAAAAEMLDEEHQDLPQDPTDSNIYTFGRIGEHNVVISCLPAGQMGNNSAAAVAMQMKARFPSLRFGLMVGIGGGVPSEESDIRLGDIIISQPHAQHGGVVQHDFGKAGVGGQITRTGSLNAPPAVLLGALSKLRANHIRGKIKLYEYLSAYARLPKFAYQGADFDVLYNAKYNHVSGPTCVGCSKEEIVSRDPREDSNPLLYFGTIASGNQVMKDGVTRDLISKELGGILCFEMEAAGLMNTFPCLVVRGICDYADSHKNKRWQPYAAATAAACAKELLVIIPPNEVAKAPPVDSKGQINDSRMRAILLEYSFR